MEMCTWCHTPDLHLMQKTYKRATLGNWQFSWRRNVCEKCDSIFPCGEFEGTVETTAVDDGWDEEEHKNAAIAKAAGLVAISHQYSTLNSSFNLYRLWSHGTSLKLILWIPKVLPQMLIYMGTFRLLIIWGAILIIFRMSYLSWNISLTHQMQRKEFVNIPMVAIYTKTSLFRRFQNLNNYTLIYIFIRFTVWLRDLWLLVTPHPTLYAATEIQ